MKALGHGRAQRRPPVPHLPRRQPPQTSATSGRSRRLRRTRRARGAGGAGRARPRASARRGWPAFADRRAERLRARLRGHRGPLARPRRARRADRRGARPRSGPVAELRRHRIAHRDLRLANIFLAADGAGLADRLRLQRAGRLRPAARHRRRRAAGLVEPEGRPRAGCRRGARRRCRPDELADAADRLRPWALSGATRTGLKQSPGLLDDLRARVQAAPPEPDRGLRTAG